jgi:DNA-nicking Smr family endonuclease
MGDKAAAAELSAKGHEEGEVVARLNARAAAAIYRRRNPETKKGADRIDLHGLFVKEAVSYLERRLDARRVEARGGTAMVEVITGAGRHSQGHVAKIRAAVLALLKRKRLRYEPENEGAFRVFA